MAPRLTGLGSSWWSQQWMGALEHRAQLDPNRLGRGRTYARKGMVLQHDISAALVLASVAGSRPTPYSVRIGIRAFDDDETDTLIEVMSSRLGFAADLLAGEVPQELLAEASEEGIELLPGAGELQLSCNCPDWAVPCKHLAAACYLTAASLDADPFGLFLLRGIERSEVEARLSDRRSASVSDAQPTVAELDVASEVWGRARADSDFFAHFGRGRGQAIAATPGDALSPVGDGFGNPLLGNHLSGSTSGAARSSSARSNTALASKALSDGAPSGAASLDAAPLDETELAQLSSDLSDAARRCEAHLLDAEPVWTDSELALDAGRRLADDHPAVAAVLADRSGLTTPIVQALARSWQHGGADAARVTHQLNLYPTREWTEINTATAALVRALLAPAGVKVRAEPTSLVLVGRRRRLVPEPGSDGGERWWLLVHVGKAWVALAGTDLERIPELADEPDV